MDESRLAVADALADWLGEPPLALVVLGSGLAGLIESLEGRREVTFSEVPGLPAPSVAGHAGRFVAGRLDGRPILAQVGRFHRYEGHGRGLVELPVRLAAGCGARVVILTNAAGSLRPPLHPGSLAVLHDYLEVMPSVPGASSDSAGSGPVPGAADPAVRVRPAFDVSLRALAIHAARELRLLLPSAVYAGVEGPSYETRAEIRMLRDLGADLVGMSTVDEVRAAARLGLPVLAISAVTNFASGVGRDRPSHDEVLSRGSRIAPALGRLLRSVVGRLPVAP